MEASCQPEDTQPLFEFDETIQNLPLSKTLNLISLERKFGWVDGVSMIIGITVGSGIFASPGPVLDFTQSVTIC